MMIFLYFISLSLFAKTPSHWSQLLEVNDKHEFYINHESIIKPRDSWQTLFSLVYMDINVQRLKDCIFFRVPGHEPGSLKIKTISANAQCDDHVLQNGDRELNNIKSLQFFVSPEKVEINFLTNDLAAHKWEASLQSQFQHSSGQLNMSSAEFKAPKIIYLARSPQSSKKIYQRRPFLTPQTLCHDINEDCEEVSKSICSQCGNGWYEVPNGCKVGPKYCGIHNCGGKNRPACRRGMKWQRQEIEFDCRSNATFAYCLKGLSVVCEGRKAFCR